MTTNDVSDFFPWFAPEGVFDIAKVCSVADYPIYGLKNNIIGFRLGGVPSYGWQEVGRESGPNYPDHLLCFYVSPSYKEFDKSMMINLSRRDRRHRMHLHELLSMIGDFMWHTPNSIKHGFDRSRLEIWKDPPWFYELDHLSGPPWKSYVGSGLQFAVFSQDEPAAFSLAYHSGEKSYTVVSAFGVSDADFLTILDSLICLQENVASIERLQRELENSRDELDQQHRRMVEQGQIRAPRKQRPSD